MGSAAWEGCAFCSGRAASSPGGCSYLTVLSLCHLLRRREGPIQFITKPQRVTLSVAARLCGGWLPLSLSLLLISSWTAVSWELPFPFQTERDRGSQGHLCPKQCGENRPRSASAQLGHGDWGGGGAQQPNHTPCNPAQRCDPSDTAAAALPSCSQPQNELLPAVPINCYLPLNNFLNVIYYLTFVTLAAWTLEEMLFIWYGHKHSAQMCAEASVILSNKFSAPATITAPPGEQ